MKTVEKYGSKCIMGRYE